LINAFQDPTLWGILKDLAQFCLFRSELHRLLDAVEGRR
jgi:hypothetical protein